MTEDEIRSSDLEELNAVAPAVDAASVGNDDQLQDDLALDSMDVVNTFRIILPERLGADIHVAAKSHNAKLSLAVQCLARNSPQTPEGPRRRPAGLAGSGLGSIRIAITAPLRLGSCVDCALSIAAARNPIV